MDNQIALNDIKSIETCKALAFDAIQRIEIEQNNLRALQQRIAELSEEMALRFEALGGSKSELAQIVNDATEKIATPDFTEEVLDSDSVEVIEQHTRQDRPV